MIYYRKININHYEDIISKSLNFVRSANGIFERANKNSSYYGIDVDELLIVCPEISQAFGVYGLSCDYAAAFVMYGPEDCKIHIDGYHKKARINLPLINCSNTFTNFYTNVKVEQKAKPYGHSLVAINNDCELADQVEVDQAVVLRTSAPHFVVLPETNPVPRITLTLGFDPDPVFLLDELDKT